MQADGQGVITLSPEGGSVVTGMAVTIIPPEWETLYPPSLQSDPYRIRAGRQDPEALDGQRYVSEYMMIELSTGKVKSLTDAPMGGRETGWLSTLSADWSSDGELVALSNTFIHSN